MSSNAARQGGLGRWIVIALGGVVFAVFAAVIWYAYVEVMGLGTGGPPPLVRAEAGPIKRAPDDPGGMEIPNRGSAVARVFDETVDGVRRERILPRQDTDQVPPEPEPASPPAQQATPGPTTPGSQAVEPATAPPVERLAAREPEPSAPLAPTQPATRPSITVTNQPPPAQPTPTQPPPTQATPPPAQQAAPRPSAPPPAATAAAPATPRPVAPPPATAQPVQPRAVTPPPQQQQAARTPPATTPPARSAPAAGPTYRVQLGAFRSDAAANQAWNLMQSRLGDALGGLRPTVLEAQTSAGTFYRLQAGPLPNRDGAVRTCSQVKAAGNDCFIVGPLP